MTTQVSASGYTVELSPAEREALLVACEYTIGAARGEHATTLRGLLADADPGRLDGLADVLFVAAAA